MSHDLNDRSLIVGAAVVVGILGTLSALLRTNKTVQGWKEQARDSANQLMNKGDAVNKNLLIGGVAGGLIGATAALLLAPKSGSELMQDIAHTLKHPGELVHPTSRKSSSSRSSSRKVSRRKSASSKASRKGESKSEEGGKSHRSPISKKKSPTRRRTATAALKASSEKAAGETTESVT